MPEACDLLIRGGDLHDGSGAPPRRADVAIRGGRVLAIGPDLPHAAGRVLDARGAWVTPGLLDIHTHYDAEVEVMPGLTESLRHGVTTVVMGNCSLSAAVGTEEQILDLFCRVENLPRALLSRWLSGRVTWRGPAGYFEHLDSLPLGPNVACFLGHSNVRMAAMGTARSLEQPRAEEGELARMRALVEEALDAGFLGLSIDLLPWHRMDREPYRGVSVPSQQAHPAEHEALADVVRARGGVLQATPNAIRPDTVLRLLGLSAGIGRRPLRTTIIAAMDLVSNRLIYRLATLAATFWNEVLHADVRFQALAEPFLNFCDGPITPIFEELSAGVAAISASAEERRAMFRDPVYRAAFTKQWRGRLGRVFHGDLRRMIVVSAPDAALAGRSFAEIAADRGQDALPCFLDLLAEHDTALRWSTVATNDRPGPVRYLLAHPATLPGFNDSGAHNRNMAFHDGGLRVLRHALEHPEAMSVERAVQRLTSEPAEWLGLDAGRVAPGARADVCVIDPAQLRVGLGGPIELADPRLDGNMRMVKRSDGVVRAVIVGGRVAFEDGAFAPDLGQARYGRLLRAKLRATP